MYSYKTKINSTVYKYSLGSFLFLQILQYLQENIGVTKTLLKKDSNTVGFFLVD